VAGTTLGDLICFEVAYDSLVQDVVHGGAQFLVVQTNNATYMGTGQDQQQFDIARLRAIETGRYVATVATNGITGLVAPDGSVVQQLPVETTDLFTASVPQLTGISPGVRFGVWVRGLLAALGVGAVLAGILARRRHPRLLHRPGRTTPPAPRGPTRSTQPASQKVPSP
jgi:apolipoprotein N-acyltransferase